MIDLKKDIFRIRSKIYNKQKKIMEEMYNKKYISKKKLKNGENEIFILEQILDSKKIWYDFDNNQFWKNV